ncbi:MAG TPA: EamA-like transporter family protein, partial [Massilia timonae]|nr:EamA-like transporter family protein [Massilia timonae]
MNLILLAAAFCIGVAMSAQAAVNSQLAHSIGTNSIMAALISFSCGTVALLVMAL